MAKMKYIIVLFIFFVSHGQLNALFTDEENARLPKLFHLDDQHRCLLQPGGLYCLGEFDLTPIGDSPVYQHILKYSSEKEAFNRSRLYRGYCVSERSPNQITNETKAKLQATKEHASQRFEQYVQKHARRYALSARLRTLKYCTTSEEHNHKKAQPPDAAQKLFMQVVYALLALNLFGTVYDLMTEDKNKNTLITSWSIRASWRRLTAVNDDGDPRLKLLEPFQGARVVTMLVIIYAHVWVFHHQFYVTNPLSLENVFKRLDGYILRNGMFLVQIFVIMSSFLTAYNIILYSEKNSITIMMLPRLVVKRIIRILPVHLLLVGFAASYWQSMRPGAASAIIEEMGVKCRQKFWTHALFLNNVVDRHILCLPPTWFLPVDMHLFILSSLLTLVMCRRKHMALKFYAYSFVLSAIFCGTTAYIYGWKTTGVFVVPDTVRSVFENAPSFYNYYTSTWGALPACFMGLFFAHFHYEMQQKKYDWNHSQWIKTISLWLIPIVMVYAYILGLIQNRFNEPLFTALYVAIDRPIFIGFCLLMLIAVVNFDYSLRWIFAWQGWRIPARLSLPIMLCHWIMGIAITGHPVTFHTSVFDMSIDYLATIFYGYLMSLPVALLVEIPVQRFFAQILKELL